MSDPPPDNPDLSTHPLVAKAQGESDTPHGLVTLIGYFGPSRKADTIRLYPSLDFRSYCELPTSAIVATEPVDPNDANSPTLVYVKAGTPVESVQTSTQSVESYLQGGIAAGYLQGATVSGHAGVAGQPLGSICAVCHSHYPVYGSICGVCHSHFPP
jgi:hypothetical protein